MYWTRSQREFKATVLQAYQKQSPDDVIFMSLDLDYLSKIYHVWGRSIASYVVLTFESLLKRYFSDSDTCFIYSRGEELEIVSFDDLNTTLFRVAVFRDYLYKETSNIRVVKSAYKINKRFNAYRGEYLATYDGAQVSKLVANHHSVKMDFYNEGKLLFPTFSVGVAFANSRKLSAYTLAKLRYDSLSALVKAKDDRNYTAVYSPSQLPITKKNKTEFRSIDQYNEDFSFSSKNPDLFSRGYTRMLQLEIVWHSETFEKLHEAGVDTRKNDIGHGLKAMKYIYDDESVFRLVNHLARKSDRIIRRFLKNENCFSTLFLDRLQFYFKTETEIDYRKMVSELHRELSKYILSKTPDITLNVVLAVIESEKKNSYLDYKHNLEYVSKIHERKLRKFDSFSKDAEGNYLIVFDRKMKGSIENYQKKKAAESYRFLQKHVQVKKQGSHSIKMVSPRKNFVEGNLVSVPQLITTQNKETVIFKKPVKTVFGASVDAETLKTIIESWLSNDVKASKIVVGGYLNDVASDHLITRLLHGYKVDYTNVKRSHLVAIARTITAIWHSKPNVVLGDTRNNIALLRQRLSEYDPEICKNLSNKEISFLIYQTYLAEMELDELHYEMLSKNIIHGDIAFGNLLFKNNSEVQVFDYDRVSFNNIGRELLTFLMSLNRCSRDPALLLSNKSQIFLEIIRKSIQISREDILTLVPHYRLITIVYLIERSLGYYKSSGLHFNGYVEILNNWNIQSFYASHKSYIDTYASINPENLLRENAEWHKITDRQLIHRLRYFQTICNNSPRNVAYVDDLLLALNNGLALRENAAYSNYYVFIRRSQLFLIRKYRYIDRYHVFDIDSGKTFTYKIRQSVKDTVQVEKTRKERNRKVHFIYITAGLGDTLRWANQINTLLIEQSEVAVYVYAATNSFSFEILKRFVSNRVHFVDTLTGVRYYDPYSFSKPTKQTIAVNLELFHYLRDHIGENDLIYSGLIRTFYAPRVAVRNIDQWWSSDQKLSKYIDIRYITNDE